MASDKFTPMKGVFPNTNKVPCRTCVFRDKTVLSINGKLIRIGVTRDYCLKYKKDESNGKPVGILLHGEECDYYRRDENLYNSRKKKIKKLS